MKVAFFDTHSFDKTFFGKTTSSHQIVYLEPRLNSSTAILAKGCDAVCSFVNDHIDAETLRVLKNLDIRLIVLRCAGFNHVDIEAAKELQIPVTRVPAYSPHAVAEHSVGLVISLNRKIHRAYGRVRELNFSLDGLVGFDLNQKTIGVIGTGRIGRVFAQIMLGFGCNVVAYDPAPDQQLIDSGVHYVGLAEIFRTSDIISLHTPLNQNTHHLIDETAIKQMKNGVVLINTSRGGLIDSKALIEGLKNHKIGAAGLDVYEEEESVFFRDLSSQGLDDDVLARLITFPNVLITSHQAFLTQEALSHIAETTFESLDQFEKGMTLTTEIEL